MSDSRQTTGRAAEQQARSHLEQQGLRLLAQNWACRVGELDLVMLDGDTVVFVEVRYRKHAGWGGALESVDARKRSKVSAAAQFFLQQQPCWAKHPCRFDVIAMSASAQPNERLNWIQNAFDS
ncbi:MAG: YraN family protein [Pseudomonas sp.]|nr:YraN family protein [Pseudomonas sp.]